MFREVFPVPAHERNALAFAPEDFERTESSEPRKPEPDKISLSLSISHVIHNVCASAEAVVESLPAQERSALAFAPAVFDRTESVAGTFARRQKRWLRVLPCTLHTATYSLHSTHYTLLTAYYSLHTTHCTWVYLPRNGTPWPSRQLTSKAQRVLRARSSARLCLPRRAMPERVWGSNHWATKER